MIAADRSDSKSRFRVFPYFHK